MNYSIEYIYKYPKSNVKLRFVSDPVSLNEVIAIGNDIEKTGRVSDMSFIDSNGVSWTKKELLKLTEVKEEEPQEITVFFDGGYITETSTSGQGIVITFTKNNIQYRLKKNSHFENLLSNNEAEYAALWLAVRELEELGVQYEEVEFKGDSKVVIEQMKGEWPCYEETLQNWADKIDKLLQKLQIRPVYTWISRKDNKETDQLVQQALKSQIIKSIKEFID